MDPQTEALAQAIGARIKQERTARGWTLDQLAQVAELSRRLIVNLEQGATNPSVSTLLKLSDALGIGLPALVAEPEHAAIRITRAGAAAKLWDGPAGGAGLLLTGTDPPDVLELWDWTLAPGERHQSAAHAPGTCELLQVLAGVLELEVGGQQATLAHTDAATFAGDQPHAYANRGTAPCRFVMACYEPNVTAHPDPRLGDG